MRETLDPLTRHLVLPQPDGERAGSALIAAILRHARVKPHAEAIGEVETSGRTCTYGELARLIGARATYLRERVAPGDGLLVIYPAGVDYVAWFCAAIAAGLHVLPMHPQVAGPEALAVAGRANIRAALISPGVASAESLHHLTLKGSAEIGNGECGVNLSRTDVLHGAGSVVLGSSGTTGLPKLALRESRSLDATAAAIVKGMGLTAEDRVVFSTPLSHSYGVDVLLGVLAAGAALRVMPRFDAELLAGEIEGGATVLPGVPFVFEALARRAPRREVALRVAVSAGSALSQRVRREFIKVWGVQVGQLFGATELGTVAVSLPGSEGFEPTSVGRPLAGVSMRVVNIKEPSQSVEVGSEGHLAVRAPSMLTQYLDGDLPLVDGHLLTGDLARMDQSGNIWITGRLKLLIDVGACKVNPLEVEGVINIHPGVAESVVVPLAASETVHRLRAVVVLHPAERPPTAEELRRFVRERLSPIKVPRVVEIVTSLPKSPTGKVIRDRV